MVHFVENHLQIVYHNLSLAKPLPLPLFFTKFTKPLQLENCSFFDCQGEQFFS